MGAEGRGDAVGVEAEPGEDPLGVAVRDELRRDAELAPEVPVQTLGVCTKPDDRAGCPVSIMTGWTISC